MPVGTGVVGVIHDLTTYGDQLILGGQFTSFNGHVRRNLQGWDGNTHFDLPGAFEASTTHVRSLEHYNGELIAAGADPNFGNIASWDGGSWNPMASGTSWEIRDLVVFGNTLVACGEDGSISRWDGSLWTSILENSSGRVNALAVYNDTLYAGTNFPPYLLRWNGSEWSSVGSGVNNSVTDLTSSGGSLVLGGYFTMNSDSSATLPYLATFDGAHLDNTTGFIPSGPVSSIIRGPGNDGIIVASSGFSTHLTQGRPIPWLPWTYAAAELNGRTFIGGMGNMSRLYPTGSSGLGELVPGDDSNNLDINGIGARSTPTSGFFFNAFGQNGPGFEAPLGSVRHSLYWAIPWLTGVYEDSLFASCTSMGLLPQEALWAPGPVSTGSDVDLRNNYAQVWHNDQGSITQHITHFNDPGYEPPWAIQGWPGNGSVSDNEPALLAPFNDLNGNGLYEPGQGDHPLMRGDHADFFILNDARPYSSWAGTTLGVDMHVMHYAYSSSWLPHLYNSIFSNIKIINRSNRTYQDLRFGMYCDWDIGGYTDDMAACDTALDLTYAYNVLPVDSDSFHAPGYGAYPPSAGCVFLNQTLTSHAVLGAFQNDPSDLFMPSQFRNLLHGLFANGDPVLDPSGTTTPFQFHGDPNVPGSWFYEPLPNAPGHDIRSISAAGPFTLAPGDTLCVDLAFVFAQDSAGGNLNSVALLKERVAQVRQWYLQQNVQCNGSYGMETGISAAVPNALALLLFPNPANDQVAIRFGSLNEPAIVRLVDGQGRLVRSERITFTGGSAVVDLSGTSSGSYTMQVETLTLRHYGRLMVMH